MGVLLGDPHLPSSGHQAGGDDRGTGTNLCAMARRPHCSAGLWRAGAAEQPDCRDQGQAAGRGRRDRDARTAPRPGLRRRDLQRRIRARARGLCRRTGNLHRRQCQRAAQDVRAVLARRPRYGRAHRQEFSHESHCRRPGHDRHQVLRAGRRRQLPRRRQFRAPADLPAARLGGARRRGIAEPRLRCHFCRRRCRLHRDRQPGRDGGGLGCRERQARLQRHRLAGRPHQGHDGAAEGRGP